MGLNSFGKIFMPKNKVFYEIFENVVVMLRSMGETMKKLVNEPDKDKRAAYTSQLEDLEHKNDENTHRVMTELGRNFITPFDREDIHALAMSLDDVADYIYASAKKMQAYDINPIGDSVIQRMAELIETGTVELENAVNGLRDMRDLRRMTESLIKINSIENQADDISDLGIEKLFQIENDIKALIKKREVYDLLEDVADRMEDVADTVESIIIKYS
jgi:predicted phosphate transport protein (TIGR00153 family)